MYGNGSKATKSSQTFGTIRKHSTAPNTQKRKSTREQKHFDNKRNITRAEEEIDRDRERESKLNK